MPNKDGTGPDGNGPKTGRQMGNCNDAKPQEKGFGRDRSCNKPRKFFRKRRIDND